MDGPRKVKIRSGTGRDRRTKKIDQEDDGAENSKQKSKGKPCDEREES